MKDQITGMANVCREYAKPQNTGQICRGGECRT